MRRLTHGFETFESIFPSPLLTLQAGLKSSVESSPRGCCCCCCCWVASVHPVASHDHVTRPRRMRPGAKRCLPVRRGQVTCHRPRAAMTRVVLSSHPQRGGATPSLSLSTAVCCGKCRKRRLLSLRFFFVFFKSQILSFFPTHSTNVALAPV